MQELIQVSSRHSGECGVFVNQAFLNHFHGDTDSGLPSPFPIPRLEHEELSILNRELNILHIAVVLLKPLADVHQLRISSR